MGFRSDQLVVWFMIILFSPTVSLADEADALLDFKNMLKDPQQELSSWEVTWQRNPCTWLHITCYGSTVTIIDLHNAGLSGPLSGRLGDLKNLVSLLLEQNSFTGNIPPELGKLGNLKTLDLHSNRLTGPIPPELGNLHNLQFMELYWNQLTGKIPGELGNLAKLNSLDLYSNHLIGYIPADDLRKLNNLVYLRLQNNNLCGRPHDDELSQSHMPHLLVYKFRPGNPNLCDQSAKHCKKCIDVSCKFCVNSWGLPVHL